MMRRPLRLSRTDTLFPYTTPVLCRRRLPGVGARQRLPVQLRLRRRDGADAFGRSVAQGAEHRGRGAGRICVRAGRAGDALPYLCGNPSLEPAIGDDRCDRRAFQIGRASCRERVCPYVAISVVAITLTNKLTCINIIIPLHSTTLIIKIY